MEFIAIFYHAPWIRYVSNGGNVIVGAIMFVIAMVFIIGAKEIKAGHEGEPYIMIGCLLGIFMAGVAFLILGADATEAYLLKDSAFSSWVPFNDYSPSMVIIIPCSIVLAWNMKKYRKGSE